LHPHIKLKHPKGFGNGYLTHLVMPPYVHQPVDSLVHIFVILLFSIMPRDPNKSGQLPNAHRKQSSIAQQN
jgi:hypothetical protein